MKQHHIGLVLPRSMAFYRQVLLGVSKYGQTKPRWVFVPIPPDTRSVRSRRAAECTGLICHASTRALTERIQELGRPWVNVSATLPEVPCPRVMVDDRSVGRLAAQYFLDRGYRSFAYVGYRRQLFSILRETGFRTQIESTGQTVGWCLSDPASATDRSGLQKTNPALRSWLAGLPKPIALFASNDVHGLQVTEACREQCISIPEQLSLLSVDDDELLCHLARPAMSSVSLPTPQLGYEAARLLDRLIRGDGPPTRQRLLPPVGIVERTSSSMLAFDDELVAAALRFIHANANRRIGVQDLLDAIPVSRRCLERRFRDALGHTLAKEICRAHVERAKRLLAETELSMIAIARASGFTDGRHFATVFRRIEQTTATEYRQRYRQHFPPGTGKCDMHNADRCTRAAVPIAETSVHRKNLWPNRSRAHHSG